MKRFLWACILSILSITLISTPVPATPSTVVETCAVHNLANAPGTPTGDATTRYWDPIVFPGVLGYPFEAPFTNGMLGPAHHHNFLGTRGLGVNSLTDQSSMLAATSTCTHPLDRSAYWTPNLVVITEESRYMGLPWSAVLTYKGGGVWPPTGLALISHKAKWDCGPGTTRTLTPHICREGSVQAVIIFQKWWNGVDLHLSGEAHASYSKVDGWVRIPRLTVRMDFAIGTRFAGYNITELSVGGMPMCREPLGQPCPPGTQRDFAGTRPSIDDPRSMHADALFAWLGDPR